MCAFQLMMFGSNPNEYDLKNELATCCYGLGTVYLAKHVPSHEYVAVKKFKMDKAKEESNMIMVSQFQVLFFCMCMYVM